MASNIQASNALLSYSSSSTCSCQRVQPISAMLHLPKKPVAAQLKLPAKNLVEQLSTFNKGVSYTNPITTKRDEDQDSPSSSTLVTKLYMVEQMVLDRVEMHKNIGEQRNNWNNLLLNSINGITLTATTMAGFATMGDIGDDLFPLKLSSSLLFSSAAGMLMIMNKIQPSQLAEEQRNATRLFKQLHGEIKAMLSIGNYTSSDINDVMHKVLALDKAFPLPLLGGVMIEKFPVVVEPSKWWPQRTHQQPDNGPRRNVGRNGWSEALEEEMKEIVKVLKTKDSEEYMRLGKLILQINKVLAISGPVLSGVAAVGSALSGSYNGAAAIGVMAGALATIVNTLEHGGQVGMVFEMYKNCGGYFKLLEETIESTLDEQEKGRRENGEMFEMKVALQLGRSLEDLRDLASKSSSSRNEFASKLF